MFLLCETLPKLMCSKLCYMLHFSHISVLMSHQSNKYKFVFTLPVLFMRVHTCAISWTQRKQAQSRTWHVCIMSLQKFWWNETYIWFLTQWQCNWCEFIRGLNDLNRLEIIWWKLSGVAMPGGNILSPEAVTSLGSVINNPHSQPRLFETSQQKYSETT